MKQEDEIDIAEMLYNLRRYGRVGSKVNGVTYIGDWTPERIANEKQGVLDDMHEFLGCPANINELCERLPKTPLKPRIDDFWADLVILGVLFLSSCLSVAALYWVFIYVRSIGR